MRPTKCKKEDEIFQAILDWEEELQELRTITGDMIIDEGGMIAALKDICIGLTSCMRGCWVLNPSGAWQDLVSNI